MLLSEMSADKQVSQPSAQSLKTHMGHWILVSLLHILLNFEKQFSDRLCCDNICLTTSTNNGFEVPQTTTIEKPVKSLCGDLQLAIRLRG